MEKQVTLVLRVPKDNKVYRAIKDKLVLKVKQDILEHKVLLVYKV